MPRRSAFSKTSRSLDELVHLNPVQKQFVTVATVGLKRTFNQIRNGERIDLSYDSSKTDCKGRYRAVIGETLVNRYRIIGIFSSHGQSAVIVKAVDLFVQEQVVIKILHVAYYKIGIQETHCLTRLASADPYHISHTVKLKASYRYGSHFCMVFETLQPEPITHHFINRSWSDQKRLCDIRRLSFKILQILSFLKQQNTIHADLKPENILLQEVDDISSVKLIDFGNAIHHVHKDVALYYQTFELQTLLYRSPEVMFGIPFGSEIDMWSLGCILAELYLGQDLFIGKNNQQMLQQISSLLGPFPCDLFKKGKFYDENVEFVDNCEQEDATQVFLQHLTGCSDYMFANFLSELLRYNPDQRLSPIEALQHPFLAAEFHVGVHLCPKVSNEPTFGLKTKNYDKKPHISSQIRRQNPNTYDLLTLGTSSLTDSFDQEADFCPTSSHKNSENPSLILVTPIGRGSGKNSKWEMDKRRLRGPLVTERNMKGSLLTHGSGIGRPSSADGRSIRVESVADDRAIKVTSVTDEQEPLLTDGIDFPFRSIPDGKDARKPLLADERSSGAPVCSVDKCFCGSSFRDKSDFKVRCGKSKSEEYTSYLNKDEYDINKAIHYDSKLRLKMNRNQVDVDDILCDHGAEFFNSGQRINRCHNSKNQKDIDSISSVSQSSYSDEVQVYQESGYLKGQRAPTEQLNKVRLNKCRFREKKRDLGSINSVSRSCSPVDSQKLGSVEGMNRSAKQASTQTFKLTQKNVGKVFGRFEEFHNHLDFASNPPSSDVHKSHDHCHKFSEDALFVSPPSSSEISQNKNFDQDLKKSECRSPRGQFMDNSTEHSMKPHCPSNRTHWFSRISTGMESDDLPTCSSSQVLAGPNMEKRSRPSHDKDGCSITRDPITSNIQGNYVDRTLSSQYHTGGMSRSGYAKKLPNDLKLENVPRHSQYMVNGSSSSRFGNRIDGAGEELYIHRTPKKEEVYERKSGKSEIQKGDANQTYILLNENHIHPPGKIEEPAFKTERSSNVDNCSEPLESFRGSNRVIQKDLNQEVTTEELIKISRSSAGPCKQPDDEQRPIRPEVLKSSECTKYPGGTNIKSKKKMRSRHLNHGNKRVDLDIRDRGRNVKETPNLVKETRRRNTVIYHRDDALCESLYYEEESSDELFEEPAVKKHLKIVNAKTARLIDTHTDDSKNKGDHSEGSLSNHLKRDLKNSVFKQIRDVYGESPDDGSKLQSSQLLRKEKTVKNSLKTVRKRLNVPSSRYHDLHDPHEDEEELSVKNINKVSTPLQNDPSGISVKFRISDDDDEEDDDDYKHLEANAMGRIFSKVSSKRLSEVNMITVQSSTPSRIRRRKNKKCPESEYNRYLEMPISSPSKNETTTSPRTLRKRKSNEEFSNDPNYITYGKCVYFAQKLYKKKD